MFSDHVLPELERTTIEIIVELLLLDKERRYPHLLFSSSKEAKSVRVSHHYVMALLSYGFSHAEDELARAVDWFDDPFPQAQNDTIDPTEMNKLMVLLELQPNSPHIQSRLRQMVKQKSNGYYDVQPGWPEFDTLWVLEALTKAKKAQVLGDIVTTDEIQTFLNNLIVSNDLKRDKDVALALRLQYDMFGALAESHEQVLDDLIQQAKENDGLWGLREFGWQVREQEWYHDLTNNNKVVYEKDANMDKFRKVILSTCLVVENLSPLMKDYPQVRQPIEQAISLWWGQFRGANAVNTLNTLFPNEYDYLLVMCRTLRAIREYVHTPLRGLDTVYLLRELTETKRKTTRSTDNAHIRRALREWIKVDLTGNPKSLKLGFSEANVVRVQPHIWNPMVSMDERGPSLITHSVIVKYGPKEMIEKERDNYDALPAALRDYFVRIPEASYVDETSGLTYVIMQDLRRYQTLYEVHKEVSKKVTSVANQLGSFLRKVHAGNTVEQRTAARDLLREIYLGRMMDYIDRMFAFAWDHHLLEDKDTYNLQYRLFEQIGDLIRLQRKLESFPTAHMHGDLHMRNIMISGLENGKSEDALIFKLIDLEFMRRDGDAAFDAGQLIVDIDLVSREETKLQSSEELQQLKQILEKVYRDFSKERHDDTFEIRVKLAKARALLRIAKGKSKRGQNFAKGKQDELARRIARDISDHGWLAATYLDEVIRAIE